MTTFHEKITGTFGNQTVHSAIVEKQKEISDNREAKENMDIPIKPNGKVIIEKMNVLQLKIKHMNL